MVFWHMGGNKLWSSVAQRCELFPSQRKHTGEAGIGLSPRSVSERQKMPWWDRRNQSHIQVLTSFFFDWQGQLRFSQLVVGRGDTPVPPCGSRCQEITISGDQTQSDHCSDADPKQSECVCAFGSQCWVNFLWASWKIWIHADKGKGGWAAFPLLGISVCWSCQASSCLIGLVGFAVSSCSCHIFSLLLGR